MSYLSFVHNYLPGNWGEWFDIKFEMSIFVTGCADATFLAALKPTNLEAVSTSSRKATSTLVVNMTPPPVITPPPMMAPTSSVFTCKPFLQVVLLHPAGTSKDSDKCDSIKRF